MIYFGCGSTEYTPPKVRPRSILGLAAQPLPHSMSPEDTLPASPAAPVPRPRPRKQNAPPLPTSPTSPLSPTKPMFVRPLRPPPSPPSTPLQAVSTGSWSHLTSVNDIKNVSEASSTVSCDQVQATDKLNIKDDTISVDKTEHVEKESSIQVPHLVDEEKIPDGAETSVNITNTEDPGSAVQVVAQDKARQNISINGEGPFLYLLASLKSLHFPKNCGSRAI